MTADDATAGSIGGKAHTLRLLADAGFLVPDGYVIDAATLARWVPGSPPPAEVAAEARRAVTELGEGPLAVRSSAIDEDDAAASFAGVYTTTLDVVGADGVLAAIEACLASRLGAPARAYRGAEPPPMAVLIQPMLAPSVAGIGFTADPVTGDRSVVRVSGVRGLGDAVASGEVTPDEWDVIDGTAHRRPTPARRR
jgi:pyruvate,water dikinase